MLRRRGGALAAAAAVGVALAASCRTIPPRAPMVAPTPPSAPIQSYVSDPVERVGILTDAARVSIAADSAVVVWGALSGDPTNHRTTLHCARFGPVAPAAAGRFRVQVASLAEESAARDASVRAREAAGLTPTLRWNADTRTYQVRVGDFATREEAKAFASQLASAGLEGAWIVQETEAVASGRIRLLDTGEEMAEATVVPEKPGEPVTVDGTPYRGIIEVRANDAGTLTVVNVLNMEDYLRGVVPNELSPSSFPQIEALKAQAVAARTYALRNRGQFKGYDICATPACQVYRGLSTENAVTDRAVEETRGLAAAYHGALINALYTSTCGGYTEDGANMFEGEGAPYLRGVACTPEGAAWATIRTTATPVALGDSEDGLARDAALLVALGVLEPRLYTASALKAVATDAEITGWTSRLTAALRRKSCTGAVDPPLNRRGTFFAHVVDAMCWGERSRRLLTPQDPGYLLQVEDRADLRDDTERLAAALLLEEGILSPFPDNTLRINTALTRGQAVAILARTAGKAGIAGLVQAEFRSAAAGELTVKRGESVEVYPLDPKARLYRALEGARVASSEITLAAGDHVSFVVQDGRIVFLEAEQSRLGAAADRTSRYYRWEVRLTPAEVAQAAAKYGRVGAVKDVVPRRIGVSGRVVELAIVGSEGDLVIKGLKIRWALGLRENLFVVNRELDPKGNVERFVFTGKGWGHGVGLCQVGAYGMAVSGASYEEILRHYYSDVTIEKVY